MFWHVCSLFEESGLERLEKDILSNKAFQNYLLPSKQSLQTTMPSTQPKIMLK